METEAVGASEQIVDFSCDGHQLIGMAHLPDRPNETGLLCIVAGGAQYRVGCCRQQVILARSLATAGVPVMRFDYRGMGDAEGDLPGADRSCDISAAIDAFLSSVPGLQNIVLYGGCDGASAVAISGWRHPAVTGWILNNPYVEEPRARAQVALRTYYLQRGHLRRTWNKLLRLEFNPWESLKSLAIYTRDAFRRPPGSNIDASSDPFEPARPFTERMLEGWKRFDGKVLMLMGGRSLVAREFDACVANSRDWQSVVHQPQVDRVDMKDADHTFSEPRSRDALSKAIAGWFRDQGLLKPPV